MTVKKLIKNHTCQDEGRDGIVKEFLMCIYLIFFQIYEFKRM